MIKLVSPQWILASELSVSNLQGLWFKASQKLKHKTTKYFHKLKFARSPLYQNPTPEELHGIERELSAAGLSLGTYSPDPQSFNEFKREIGFPADYHGGAHGGVYDEKLLEHFIAWDLLNLKNLKATEIYIDVAAGGSPWAQILRSKLPAQSFALDLNVSSKFKNFPYYLTEDATQTSFADNSVSCLSLQCAYELFIGQNDIDFIKELARIMKPGGRCIISPLYMHTHYCGYSTPEYFGKNHNDRGSVPYIRWDCSGIPFSRKYDAKTLQKRVLAEITKHNLSYKISVVRNKTELGKGIYCHFILEIIK